MNLWSALRVICFVEGFHRPVSTSTREGPPRDERQ